MTRRYRGLLSEVCDPLFVVADFGLLVTKESSRHKLVGLVVHLFVVVFQGAAFALGLARREHDHLGACSRAGLLGILGTLAELMLFVKIVTRGRAQLFVFTGNADLLGTLHLRLDEQLRFVSVLEKCNEHIHYVLFLVLKSASLPHLNSNYYAADNLREYSSPGCCRKCER